VTIPTRGATGGAANEAGAAHRAGIAAVVMTHGLRGERVPWLASAAAPVRLTLEADAHVDDLIVELGDDTRAFIQAKLSSGLNQPFRDTATQWCLAIRSGQCSDGDELLLVVAEPTGTLRKLAAALDSQRAGASLSSPALKRVNDLRSLAQGCGLGDSGVERLLRVAAVRFLDARKDGAQEREGAAWLDASVVAAGTGLAGFRALRAAAREMATVRAPAGVDSWRGCLSQAGMPLVSDAAGLFAAQLQAEDGAVATYLGELARDRDMLPLADLGFGLTSMTVPGLADGLLATRVGSPAEGGSNQLVDFVRRQGRMLLVGLPGAGKSVALAQVAATWAGRAGAPIPMRARLFDLAQRLPAVGPYWLDERDVALTVAGAGRTELAAALERRLRQGQALLLLDGVDEVVDRRDAAMEAIGGLLGRLAPSVDVVVASRHSSAESAASLGLPVFELNEPRDLTKTLHQLLEEIAGVRDLAGLPAGWLTERRAYMVRSKNQDSALWAVPLLATLTVLLLAERSPAEMPKSRAGLLAAVIAASVKRWEIRKANVGVPGMEAGLTADALLDCYADIAHVVVTGSCEWELAATTVVERLRDHWGLAAGPAKTAAVAIVEHWDATAGVFVTDQPRGPLTSRTRLFAEIGEAMWAARNDARAAEWMPGAVNDPGRRESARLAAGLSPTAARVLCELAISDGGAQLDVALDILQDGADPGGDRAAAVRNAQLDRLSQLPAEPPAPKAGSFLSRRVSPAAALAVRLACDDLDHDQSRRLLVATARLGDQQARVVAALTTASAAYRQYVRLDEARLDTLEAALLEPADSDHPRDPELAGLDQLIDAALRHLVPARPHTAYRVAVTAYETTFGTLIRAEEELVRLGHADAFAQRCQPGSHWDPKRSPDLSRSETTPSAC